MTADGIPFSPAAERNSEPIAKRLVPLMQAVETVLEIASDIRLDPLCRHAGIVDGQIGLFFEKIANSQQP